MKDYLTILLPTATVGCWAFLIWAFWALGLGIDRDTILAAFQGVTW